MSTNRYVYRYRDWNRGGDGAARLFVERRLIIKETDKYVYHIPLPYDWDRNPTIDQSMIDFCLKTNGFNRARKTRKDAFISAWRLDQKAAMGDWIRRKGYQISRLRLAIERVEELLNTGIKDGVFLPQTGSLSPQDRVILSPDVMDGAVTPEAYNYNWQEY